jgi:DNA-binding NarL/FixJ family response regulator
VVAAPEQGLRRPHGTDQSPAFDLTSTTMLVTRAQSPTPGNPMGGRANVATARQREIALLAAQGATNAEIAQTSRFP